MTTNRRECPDCGSTSWAGVRCYGHGHTAPRTITARCAVCGEDVREIPAHLYTGGEELCDEHAAEYGTL